MMTAKWKVRSWLLLITTTTILGLNCLDFENDQALIDGSPLVSELSLSSMSARDSVSFNVHDRPGTSGTLPPALRASADNMTNSQQQRDSEVTTMSTVTDSDTLNCSSHSGSFRKISTGSAISAFQQTDETSDQWRYEDDSGKKREFRVYFYISR